MVDEIKETVRRDITEYCDEEVIQKVMEDIDSISEKSDFSEEECRKFAKDGYVIKRIFGYCKNCKWYCGRETVVGIECMQPDNQSEWQSSVKRYKHDNDKCRRYEKCEK